MLAHYISRYIAIIESVLIRCCLKQYCSDALIRTCPKSSHTHNQVFENVKGTGQNQNEPVL